MKRYPGVTPSRCLARLAGIIIGLTTFSLSASATVAFASLFKTNSVLQRDMPLNVYGTGAPGEQVTVTYARTGYSKSASATTDAGGRWLAVLPALPASFNPATLTATGTNTVALSNVLVGEVWLAAGQSNMQMTFDWGDQAALSQINEPYVRRFSISPWYSSTPLDDYPSGAWSTGSVQNEALYFSQASYYFAKQLRDQLNVPVGMLPVALSGTRIRSWMTTDAISSDPAGVFALANPGNDQNSPAACYNAMINPVLKHTFRGVIWYQGESDATDTRPDQYRTLFPTLIRSWREDFGRPSMPFYFVQLPQYNAGPYNDWPAMRAAQAMGLKETGTGMAVMIDSGESGNIHPHDKPLVGERLGRLALKRTYGQASVVDSGPLFGSVDFESDGTVRVHFTDVGGGLTGASSLNGFELAGTDEVFHSASAVIDSSGSAVLVSSTAVPIPVRIRYAWSNHYPSGSPLSLANSAGLPAAPFEAGRELVPVMVEFESVSPSASSDTVSTIYDAAASKGAASKLSSNAVGDYAAYDIFVPSAGTYSIRAAYKGYTSRGRFQLSIDGVSQGGVQDEYGATAMFEIDLGTRTFATAGTKEFRFTVTGKNAASTGYDLTYDYILLTPVVEGAVKVPTWGVCGHPTFPDYQNWNAAPRAEQIGYLQELGCSVYRCSFDYSGGPYPALMDNIVPAAQTAGITVLPILPLKMSGSGGETDYATVYNANYSNATTWANYAVSHGYELPYWELGNELENNGMLTVSGDGASASQYADSAVNGFERIRGALNGAYDGLRSAYAAARTAGTTQVKPRILYGATWRHWGLLSKIQIANGAAGVPWDIISWHWYTPSFGDFTATITSTSSASYGRSPVECLNDFKSKSSPSEPMDIWITEMGRSQNISGQGFVGGSATSVTNPTANQNWALQSSELQSEIDDLVVAPGVKAVIVYELFDEPGTFAPYGTSALAAEGYFGLVTGLGGTKKNAFYGFQAKVAEYRDAVISTAPLIGFNWGDTAQTGAGVLGAAGDQWGLSGAASRTSPLALSDTTGAATGITLTWSASSIVNQATNQYWSPYDAGTAALMTSYLTSYQYTSAGSGAVTFTLAGLTPNRSYTLILHAGGLYTGSTPFSATGSSIVNATVSGNTRRISDGEGVAYVTLNVTSSAAGTIDVRTTKNGGTVYLNGFQLR